MRALLFVLAIAAAGCAPRLYTSQGDVAPWSAPDNGWPLQPPPETLKASGFSPGQVPPDARLVDQHGDVVSLWQFHGLVVLLDISTMWCAPCQKLAEGTEHTYADFRDQGFMYVTVLQEDVESAPPEVDDLALWASTFGISSPVLADGEDGAGGDSITASAVQRGQFPALLVLNRDMTVRARVNPSTDEAARLAIEAALAD